jgi:hypothetical protein
MVDVGLEAIHNSINDIIPDQLADDGRYECPLQATSQGRPGNGQNLALSPVQEMKL